jgi:glycerate kinase
MAPSAPHLRVLVAPDAFKGTFSAGEAAAAVARGVRAAGAQARELPVADGGEGSVAVLTAALGGEPRVTTCSDPLGRPVQAHWTWLAGPKTALLEMAGASGLVLVGQSERDAEAASSAGTGDLLLAARDAGAREAVLAIGGTATSDGGAEALQRIDAAGGLGEMRLTLACDVDVPFERAAEVFGPQKGATPQGVLRLTARLHALAETLPRDPRGMSLSGAGGGLAGSLWASYEARLLSGACYVLDTLGFDELLGDCDAVVVGEGRLDSQSRGGKIAGEILARASRRGVPVHAVAGSIEVAATNNEWSELASLQVAGTLAELERAGCRIASL